MSEHHADCRACERYSELLASAQKRGAAVEEEHILALWREHDLRVGHVTP